MIALGGVYSSDILQEYVDRGWEALIEKEWFLSVYFETWWTVLVYTTLVVVFMLMSVLPLLTEFKLNVAARPKPQLGRYAVQFFLYVTPIFALDAFTVKHYAGVPREALPRTTWLIFNWAKEQQTTRIFPSAAPRVWEILWHMVVATVLYDLFFCTAHFFLHKVPFLYQHLHKSHHSHPQGMLADVTGQLALAENLADILLANLALKLVGAHPMTRFLYVPILLLLLVDNHAGFDFPWNYHRVVPFGVCGGGPAHFDHHQKSAVHYQPFFTYLNPLLSNL